MRSASATVDFSTRWALRASSSRAYSNSAVLAPEYRSPMSSSLSSPSRRRRLPLRSTELRVGLRSLKSSASSSCWNSSFSNSLAKRGSIIASFFLWLGASSGSSSRSTAPSRFIIFCAKAELTLGRRLTAAMRLWRLASILSWIFFLRCSSYSNGLLTARSLLYNFISMKNPCMYPLSMGVPSRPVAPISSTSFMVKNLKSSKAFWPAVSSSSSVRLSRKEHQRGAGPNWGTKYVITRLCSPAIMINPLWPRWSLTTSMSLMSAGASILVMILPILGSSRSQIFTSFLSVVMMCREAL
mmetsp:Transcript_33547/g.57529  ORF Transcript_33547/g.57529 Transcript_33547/m.57529 type:complete len:298 (-) Transcript_33547:41-934(-)